MKHIGGKGTSRPILDAYFKSPINENADAYITCDFGDSDISRFLMLVSHCGECMANGLTNSVRDEFVMIAK